MDLISPGLYTAARCGVKGRRPLPKEDHVPQGPEFYCIGAQKAATTWLAAQLFRHPEIWKPFTKELHYFDTIDDAASREFWRARHAKRIAARVRNLTEGTGAPERIEAFRRIGARDYILTEDWYRGIIERGLTPHRYVELVAVVATANCLEVFAGAIGADPVSLPGPVEGNPDGSGDADAEVSTHWVPTVPGRGPNVGKALPAVPVAVTAWNRLSDAQYVPRQALLGDLTWSRGALDRMQVELLAATTSLLNECFY